MTCGFICSSSLRRSSYVSILMFTPSPNRPDWSRRFLASERSVIDIKGVTIVFNLSSFDYIVFNLSSFDYIVVT